MKINTNQQSNNNSLVIDYIYYNILLPVNEQAIDQ